MVENGVLGPIKAYFGTVENQGRGSLHLHILMWLDHDLTSAKLKELTQNEEFRNGLLSYFEDIIKQDLINFDFEISETNGKSIFLSTILKLPTYSSLFLVHERQQTFDSISNNELGLTSTESMKDARLVLKSLYFT